METDDYARVGTFSVRTGGIKGNASPLTDPTREKIPHQLPETSHFSFPRTEGGEHFLPCMGMRVKAFPGIGISHSGQELSRSRGGIHIGMGEWL